MMRKAHVRNDPWQFWNRVEFHGLQLFHQPQEILPSKIQFHPSVLSHQCPSSLEMCRDFSSVVKGHCVTELLERFMAGFAFYLHLQNLITILREKNPERIEGVNGSWIAIRKGCEPAKECGSGDIFEVSAGERRIFGQLNLSVAVESLNEISPPIDLFSTQSKQDVLFNCLLMRQCASLTHAW